MSKVPDMPTSLGNCRGRSRRRGGVNHLACACLLALALFACAPARARAPAQATDAAPSHPADAAVAQADTESTPDVFVNSADTADSSVPAEDAAGPADTAIDVPPACSPTVEQCNGKDDDCDGQTDEGLCPKLDACIDRACVPATGECALLPLTGPECDDGEPCTVGDHCQDGACAHAGLDSCDDGNACTGDVCISSMGGCQHGDVPGPCDDGNPCTQPDACKSGSCQGILAPVADDANPCTDDGCDPATGKPVYLANTATCEGWDFCTVDWQCSGGECVGSPKCIIGNGKPCTQPACDQNNGACLNIAATGTCDDGDPCTAGDHCTLAGCLALPVDCDDADPCTVDACSKSGSCTHVPGGAGLPQCGKCPAGLAGLDCKTLVPKGFVAIAAGTLLMGCDAESMVDGSAFGSDCDDCANCACDVGQQTAECVTPLNQWKNSGIVRHCLRCATGACDHEELPQHATEVGWFLLGQHEVTQQEWQAVMVDNPSAHTPCDDCPVEGVRFGGAADYANARSKADGLETCYELKDCFDFVYQWFDWNSYGDPNFPIEGIDAYPGCKKVTASKGVACKGWRLPTEAEWEFAARAGTSGQRYGKLGDIAWTEANSGGDTHAVGGKKANAFGLYDMIGNVWEWTEGKAINAIPTPYYNGIGYVYGLFGTLQPYADYVVTAVRRGGSWRDRPQQCRSAARYLDGPIVPTALTGLRLARTL